MKPFKRTEHRAQSAQSKMLRRRLSTRLFMEWVAFTALYVLLGALFAAPAVSAIADFVANETSEWEYYKFENLQADEVLNQLSLELLGYVCDDKAIDYIGDAEKEDMTSVSASAGSSDTEFGYVPIKPYRKGEDYNAGNEAAAGVVEEVDDWGTSTVADSDSKIRYANEDNMTKEGIDLADVNLFVKPVFGGDPYIATLRELQVDAVKASIDDLENTQIIPNADSVAVRDLTVYNMIRPLKWPLLIGLYLIGCLVIVFLGYGRAMRYFDELENAVESVIKDREKPIELPPALVLTQNELNNIRLTSLADERAAKAAERRKDELVAYLAHDIKTPLTSVIGYLMLLDESPDLPEDVRRRYIHTTSEKSQRMEGLVDEFFEITRYNLQAIPIERENADLRLFCEQVAEEFYPEASSRGISIRIDSDEGVEFLIDRDKLARALGNVVRNAVAYADSRTEIKIEATQSEAGDGPAAPLKGTTTIKVSNKGREISETHLMTIFEKFYREDSSRASSKGGSGLGLAISKEIVEAHGGTISATSEYGVTTFTIAVPTGQ